MINKKPMIANRIFKAVFVVFIVVSISIFYFSANEVDPDLYGHLKFGQDIFEKKDVPRYDVYSYSSAGARWINHEWLSELTFYTIYKFAGSPGLIIFKTLLGFFLALLLFVSISTRTRSVYIRLLFFFIPLALIKPGFMVRPQIFTFLFFAIFVYLLDEYERKGKWYQLYGLPVIALIWCNMHGGFVAGIGVLVFYLMHKISRKEVTFRLSAVTILTMGVTLFNPNGRELWLFLFRSLSSSRPQILEWQKVSFSMAYVNYFVVVAMAIYGISFSKIKRSYFEMGILLMLLVLSLRQQRHMVLFAIAVMIYVPKYADSFVGTRLRNREKDLSQKDLICVLLPLSMFFSFVGLHTGKTNPLKLEVPQAKYPVEAIMFMNANKITGNILSTFDWAEMCIRELPETSKVFFDGRYKTVYSDDLIKAYFEILDGEKDYRSYLSNFPETDIIFVHTQDPIAEKVKTDKDWISVYESPLAIIFLKNNNNNKKTIQKYNNNGLISQQISTPYYFK